MKLNLSAISALAEIISSIAILVTIAYLAIQTQQTNQALRADSREATMLADVQLLSLSFEHPEVFLDLLPVKPSIVEFQRGEYLIAMTRIREFAWFQYQNGILDRRAWEAYLRPLLWLHQIDEVKVWWSQWQNDFDPDFVSHINDRVRSDQMAPQKSE